VRSGKRRRSCKRKIGEQRGDEITIRVLPVKALGWGLQEQSGENDRQGGMI